MPERFVLGHKHFCHTLLLKTLSITIPVTSLVLLLREVKLGTVLH